MDISTLILLLAVTLLFSLCYLVYAKKKHAYLPPDSPNRIMRYLLCDPILLGTAGENPRIAPLSTDPRLHLARPVLRPLDPNNCHQERVWPRAQSPHDLPPVQKRLSFISASKDPLLGLERSAGRRSGLFSEHTMRPSCGYSEASPDYCNTVDLNTGKFVSGREERDAFRQGQNVGPSSFTAAVRYGNTEEEGDSAPFDTLTKYVFKEKMEQERLTRPPLAPLRRPVVFLPPVVVQTEERRSSLKRSPSFPGKPHVEDDWDRFCTPCGDDGAASCTSRPRAHCFDKCIHLEAEIVGIDRKAEVIVEDKAEYDDAKEENRKVANDPGVARSLEQEMKGLIRSVNVGRPYHGCEQAITSIAAPKASYVSPVKKPADEGCGREPRNRRLVNT